MHHLFNGSGPPGNSWEAPVDVWERSLGQPGPGHVLGRRVTSGDDGDVVRQINAFIYRGNAFIAFISFIAFVGDRRLYFGVYIAFIS